MRAEARTTGLPPDDQHRSCRSTTWRRPGCARRSSRCAGRLYPSMGALRRRRRVRRRRTSDRSSSGTRRCDPRIRVTLPAPDRRHRCRVERGPRLATGEYVGFLDHDDVLYPSRCSRWSAARAGARPRRVVYYRRGQDRCPTDGGSALTSSPTGRPICSSPMNYIVPLLRLPADPARAGSAGPRAGFEGARTRT